MAGGEPEAMRTESDKRTVYKTDCSDSISLKNAYKEGKEYTSVKARIELLGNLASKGTENLSAGNLYTRLNELESKYNELNDKINTY